MLYPAPITSAVKALNSSICVKKKKRANSKNKQSSKFFLEEVKICNKTKNKKSINDAPKDRDDLTNLIKNSIDKMMRA